MALAPNSCPPPLSAQLLLGKFRHVLSQAMDEGREEIGEQAKHDDKERGPVKCVPKCPQDASPSESEPALAGEKIPKSLCDPQQPSVDGVPQFDEPFRHIGFPVAPARPAQAAPFAAR